MFCLALRRLFRKFDTDASGTLDRAEFRALIEATGLLTTKATNLDALMNELDTDHSTLWRSVHFAMCLALTCTVSTDALAGGTVSEEE